MGSTMYIYLYTWDFSNCESALKSIDIDHGTVADICWSIGCKVLFLLKGRIQVVLKMQKRGRKIEGDTKLRTSSCVPEVSQMFRNFP